MKPTDADTVPLPDAESDIPPSPRARILRRALKALVALLVLVTLVGLYWNFEPDLYDVREVTERRAGLENMDVTGATSTAVLIENIDTLLSKRGGFLSNDVLLPGAALDNLPNWEWGVLRQCRDFAIVLRNDLSRSQTQSTEDADLVRAETKLHIDSQAWMFPAAEAEYADAREALGNYLARLSDPTVEDAQFYARADNLVVWLGMVEKRLGDLSQRLSASVGQMRVNVDLGGESAAEQSTEAASERLVKTPFFTVDDVFFEARGSSWALIHLLKGVEQDFAPILEKKNARVSLRQIIRELEATQAPIRSPLILNGKGFGVFANHSLVMASYISRANAALIDLKDLLQRG